MIQSGKVFSIALQNPLVPGCTVSILLFFFIVLQAVFAMLKEKRK